MWKIGDVVVRKSYRKDICFMIAAIDSSSGTAVLKGMDVRLIADASLDDLEAITKEEFDSYRISQFKLENESLRLVQLRRQVEREKLGYRSERKRKSEDFFELPGRVLHLDGDGTYLEKCLLTYNKLGIRAVGKNLPEAEMVNFMPKLLNEYEPDILIITGHDSVLREGKHSEMLRMDQYRNSNNFVQAVRAARRYERSLDELIIFAGACQSHFEALLEAGANFASSPERILIHALDPVLVAEKIAFTPIHETIDIYELVQSTITGIEGLGGIESRGKYRIGLPRSRF
jgi:spore coat assembly protein